MQRIALVFMVLPLALAACGGGESRVARQLDTDGVGAAGREQDDGGDERAPDVQRLRRVRRAERLSDRQRRFRQCQPSRLVPSRRAGVRRIRPDPRRHIRHTWRAPFLKAFLPAGKTWLKLDGKTRSSALPKSIPQDPKAGAGALEEARRRTQGRRGDDRRTSTTTHYHGVGRLDHGAFDVWIGNDDGFVRRVRARANGKQGHGELVVTLSDFGESVSVTPPPASETADAAALMSSFKTNLFKRGCRSASRSGGTTRRRASAR